MTHSLSTQRSDLFEISFSDEELSGSLTDLLKRIKSSFGTACEIREHLEWAKEHNLGSLVILNESDVDRPVMLPYTIERSVIHPDVRDGLLNGEAPCSYAGLLESDFKTDAWSMTAGVCLMGFARSCWNSATQELNQKTFSTTRSYHQLQTLFDYGLEYGTPRVVVVYIPIDVKLPTTRQFPYILLGYTRARKAIAVANMYLDRL